MPKGATLVIVQTSPACLSYRLVDAGGTVIWLNRVFASGPHAAASDAGARERMAAWARRHGWKVIDAATGAVNHEINWTLHVGDRVKIRLDNAAGGDHQMHHPFHIHGAGRFLVLERNGVEERNLVWKDTVLVRGGEIVDILFDVTNPGRWMAHCHIAEHTESGMMFSFDVVREPSTTEVV